jgi:hypothetical protein
LNRPTRLRDIGDELELQPDTAAEIRHRKFAAWKAILRCGWGTECLFYFLHHQCGPDGENPARPFYNYRIRVVLMFCPGCGKGQLLPGDDENTATCDCPYCVQRRGEPLDDDLRAMLASGEKTRRRRTEDAERYEWFRFYEADSHARTDAIRDSLHRAQQTTRALTGTDIDALATHLANNLDLGGPPS